MKKYIVSILFVIAISTAPLFASAQTTPTQAQLTQQLIQVLTQLIVQLEQQLQQVLAQQSTTQQTLQQLQQNTQQTTINSQPQSTPQAVTLPSTSDTTTITDDKLITISANPAFLTQITSPNTKNAEIGSYIIKNQSSYTSILITQLEVITNDSSVSGVKDLTFFKTSETTGSGTTAILPSGDDIISVQDQIPAGGSKEVDIFANIGSDSTGTIQTRMSAGGLWGDYTPAYAGFINGQSISIVQPTQ